MLDYKDIIVKHFGLGMSGRQIARELGVSKSGVNDVLGAFKRCESLDFPLPEGITNYGIAAKIYGGSPGAVGRDMTYACPDFEEIHKQLHERKNMTLVYLWNRYMKTCEAEGRKGYQYRQFCKQYSRWCETNKESMHITAVSGQKMEVDFAGKTFQMVEHLTGELLDIVIFVAVLPYSQYVYAEGMTSTREPQWIAVDNHSSQYFGGVPALVACDNCKQAVIANRDWIAPELNRDYAEWAEHNHTLILPARVKKPKYKSSVENAVGILEKGISMIWRSASISAWNSSMMTSGAALNGSTMHRLRRKSIAGAIIGKRNGKTSWNCPWRRMSTWSARWQRYPRITTSALTTPITALGGNFFTRKS